MGNTPTSVLGAGENSESGIGDLDYSSEEEYDCGDCGEGGSRNFIEFYINGKLYSVKACSDNLEPSSVLVDFIRIKAGLTGTKFTCREGGCGACVVTVKTKDLNTGEQIVRAVNSCLTPVFTCDGWDITTVEQLGNQKNGYHPIQQRLSRFGGSQCGFCSSGMVMNMYSLLQSKKEVTTKDVEESFDGNICRCTGYRPIQDAFKSMAIDAPDGLRMQCSDIEDCATCIDCPKAAAQISADISTIHLCSNSENIWVKVKNVQMAFAYIHKFKSEGKKYRLVAGDTAKGIYKNDGPYNAYVDISSVAELSSIHIDLTGAILGGGVTLKKAIDFFEEISDSPGFEYCAGISRHIKRIANTPVRNVATLAGNLMIKHNHNEFPSDIFTLMETVGARINIATATARSMAYTTRQYSLIDFLSLDMDGKVIISLHLTQKTSDYVFRSFKISRRYQNSHAYVNAGFLLKVDSKRSFEVMGKSNIVYGGISPSFVHATKTEAFLMGKSLYDINSLRGAMITLHQEVEPDNRPPEGSPAYRKFLTQSLLYKTILGIVGTRASTYIYSGQSEIERGPMSGRQSFSRNTNAADAPLYEPIPKLEGPVQMSGEAEYINDIEPFPNELFGAFVISTVAKANLKGMDASEALKIPGVVSFIQAKDIPGVNNYMIVGYFPTIEPDTIFVENEVIYAGQPLGMILAESRDIAFAAVKKVVVTYENVKKPNLDLVKLVKQFEDDGTLGNQMVSTVAIEGSSVQPTRMISGEFRSGAQYHMHMETQCCLVVPTEDSFDIYSSTQWMDHVQSTVSTALNIPNNRINITVRRLGGAFGSKVTRSSLIAAAAAVGANATRRPVRVITDLETNMQMIGKRHPFFMKYRVGVNNEGKILSLEAVVYNDTGATRNESVIEIANLHMQNVYRATGWEVTSGWIKTDTTPHTYCRSPVSLPGVTHIEYIIEHIAQVLKKDPMEVRAVNYFGDGDVLLSDQTKQLLGENPILKMTQELKITADYERRLKYIQNFNKSYRWKKRGIAFTPNRFSSEFIASRFRVFVAVYHEDGSVAISHGVTEMGQSVNTKVAQTVAYALKIPMSKISIKPTNNLIGANSYASAASTSTELCCYAAIEACKILLERILPIRQQYPEITWEELIKKSFAANIDLSVEYMYKRTDPVEEYQVYGVNVAEVEVDILTGENKIVRVDLIEDAGSSLNPIVDIGQVEGAYVMGIGMLGPERIVYDENTGELLTRNTWEYKVPEPRDIPEDFRVTLLKNASNPFGVLRSKAISEPPIGMSIAVLFAIRNAIESARRDVGNTEWFQIDTPVTFEDIVRLSLTSPAQFIF